MNQGQDETVYSKCSLDHVLEMIARPEYKSGIHLFIGSGFETNAVYLRSTGMETVFAVSSDEELKALTKGGFEAYKCKFDGEDGGYGFLRHIAGSRKTADIIAFNLIENLKDPEIILQALNRFANEENILMALCAANITHRDYLFALLSGEIDSRDAAMQNLSLESFITEKTLNRLMEKTGWVETARNDYFLDRIIKGTSSENLFLQDESMVHNYLKWLKGITDRNATTYRFVRVYKPSSVPENEKFDAVPKKPFLSIITRTQGKRISALREVFLCLAGQECVDFEVLVMGHKVDGESCRLIEDVIKETPDWLREKIRLIKVDYGTRTIPLMVGFNEAKGRYISILDDDDLVFANWVETFYKLYEEYPGRILRTNCVRQDWTSVETKYGETTMRASGPHQKLYSEEFDMVEQFYTNNCPTLTLAFPASAYHDFEITFDEKLTTTEDWDFLMRSALICGAASSKAVTCIYRWWVNGNNSFAAISTEEWEQNQNAILLKLDAMPVVLPTGSISQIRYLSDIKYKYMNIVNGRGKDTLYKAKTRLYVDTGEGFSGEKFEISKNTRMGYEYEVIFKDLNRYGKITALRWDPTEGRFIFIRYFTATVRYKDGRAELIPLERTSPSGYRVPGGFWFPRRDPRIIIPVNSEITSVSLTGKWSRGYYKYALHVLFNPELLNAMIRRVKSILKKDPQKT